MNKAINFFKIMDQEKDIMGLRLLNAKAVKQRKNSVPIVLLEQIGTLIHKI